MEASSTRLILVPTDFSAPAAHALRYAAALADRFGAHLLVIYADTFLPPVEYTMSAGIAFAVPYDELIESARERMQTFAEENITTAVPYDVRVLVDTPVEAILNAIRASGASLVVMGTHGRTGLRRMIVGSVTEAVVRVAPVPVITVTENTPEIAGIATGSFPALEREAATA